MSNASETNSVRTTGRIKKPKAVFDPSDYNLPRTPRTPAASHSSIYGQQTTSTAASEKTPRSAASHAGRQSQSAAAAANNNADSVSSAIVSASSTVLTASSAATTATATAAAAATVASTSTTTTSTAAAASVAVPSSSPSVESTQSTAADKSDLCLVCLKRDAKRGSYTNRNKLINCVVCLKKVHRLCLDLDFESLSVLRQHYHCDECRYCEICFTSDLVTAETKEMMVTCVKCIKSYHIFCHVPAVSKQERFERTWRCANCPVQDSSMQQASKSTNALGDNSLKANNSSTGVGGTGAGGGGSGGVNASSTKILPVAKAAVNNAETLRITATFQHHPGEKKLTTKQLVSNALILQQQQPQQQMSIAKNSSNMKTTSPFTSTTGGSLSSIASASNRSLLQEENKQHKNTLKKSKLDDFKGIPPLKMINNHKEMMASPAGKVILANTNSGKNGLASVGGGNRHHTPNPSSSSTNSRKRSLVGGNVSMSQGNNEQGHHRVSLPKVSPSSTIAARTRNISEEPINVPDVKNWSVDQVANYIAKYFPNEAQVFRDQEIDGMSLLLLKRSDIVKKLPFKLGPSLRLYSFILKIQTKLNDSTLGWHTATSSQ